MRSIALRMSLMSALLCIGVTAAWPVLAGGKPPWAGGGQGGPYGQDQMEEQPGGHGHGGPGGKHDEHGARTERHFQDHDRVVVRNYYAEQFRAGHCPPGLAKKHDGCMPPGQAKRWRIGSPLPRGVVFYNLPPALVVQLGPPSAGYRYVRVASDILMIATGTGMVVDALQDLGRM